MEKSAPTVEIGFPPLVIKRLKNVRSNSLLFLITTTPLPVAEPSQAAQSWSIYLTRKALSRRRLLCAFRRIRDLHTVHPCPWRQLMFPRPKRACDFKYF